MTDTLNEQVMSLKYLDSDHKLLLHQLLIADKCKLSTAETLS